METLLQSQQSHNDNIERVTHDHNRGRSVYRPEGEIVFHDPDDDDVKCTICMDTIQPGEFVCRL